MEMDTSANTDKKTARFEINAGFEGEVMTLKEAVDISGKSKVTVLKIIKDEKISAVGKIVSGSRGRPANLYDRVKLLSVINN